MSHPCGIIEPPNDERTAMPIMLTDGNAFAIIGAGRRELERTGRGDEVSAFTAEMTAGDYNHLLRTMMAWFPDVVIAD